MCLCLRTIPTASGSLGYMDRSRKNIGSESTRRLDPPSLNNFYVYPESNCDRLCIPLTVDALSHRLKSLTFYFGGNTGCSFLNLFFVYNDSTLEQSFMKIIQLKWHHLFVIILLTVFGFPWTHKLFLSLLCSGYFQHRCTIFKCPPTTPQQSFGVLTISSSWSLWKRLVLLLPFIMYERNLIYIF